MNNNAKENLQILVLMLVAFSTLSFLFWGFSSLSR